MGFSLSSWRSKPTAKPAVVDADRNYTSDSSDPALLRDGNLAFTRVQGGNDSKPTYQEAIGAPVESNSPLGYHVGWLTIIFLNVNQMIGTGIFSTRKWYCHDVRNVLTFRQPEAFSTLQDPLVSL